GSIELKLHDMVRAAKSSEHCTIKMAKENATPRFSIFRNKRVRGWWPFIKGKVEAEFQLLTVEEADKSPVGLGRKGPE
ncbi:OTOF protein, partial [Certhia familiaris]|nr:OTOF protein [Certhia familiaris]